MGLGHAPRNVKGTEEWSWDVERGKWDGRDEGNRDKNGG